MKETITVDIILDSTNITVLEDVVRYGKSQVYMFTSTDGTDVVVTFKPEERDNGDN
jgi:hypothetical protein